MPTRVMDMTTNSRRTVLTGLGVICPIGAGPAVFWQNLLAGVPGVHTITSLDPFALPSKMAGEVRDFSAKSLIDKSYRRTLNAMARTVEFGVVGCQQAMQDSGLTKGSVPPERIGVEFASVMGATELDDLGPASKKSIRPDSLGPDMAAWGSQGLNEVPPLWMLKYLPNMPACHASIIYDIQGPSNTQIPGDTAGAVALGEALRIIRRGAADIMLVGGSEAKIHPLSLSRFNLFAQFSKRNHDPEGAIRPFDRDRDGTAPGEGVAAFTLEDLVHARLRKAKIYGEVVSVASGVDRGMTGPGLARVIRNALNAAGIQPSDVDHVNAHGLGTTNGDAFEARGIGEVFGRSVQVFAPLSRFGNLGAGSSLIELACSVLALQHGLLPGTLNHVSTDPACPVSVHTGAPRTVEKPYAVKLSNTELGQCSAIVIRKWQE
ncbi:MAG TPA: beta-ketoacyl-[acyl-carrier-protein] synthase family protein [Gemmata sp.]|jgi:3-oxoacyl-[acyl-carrier-protein] synthase II|nr:beta-ketoacyl-[acyl-carrier-protein] synthase family protein [Gemmata sp.]